LELSRIEGSSDGAKVGGTKGCADASVISIALPLSVVPDVEGIRAEFDTAVSRLADDEALEQREIPVVTTRAADRVKSEVAPCARRRRSERRRIKPSPFSGK
jgi:hypothetical protein